MKKLLNSSLLLILAFFSSAVMAQYNDEYLQNDCQPFECNSWGIQIDAGVRPVQWRKRGDFYTVNCLSTTITNDIGELPSFRSLFRIPWQVGGQLSYNFSENAAVFLEFNYAQARFRHSEDLMMIGTSNLVLNLSKYKVYDGYIGARYYCDRWCNMASFFFGGKVGFIHHKAISTGTFTGITGCTTDLGSSAQDLFGRNTSVAGGGQIGLDFCFCSNWSFVITAEVVAACGPAGIIASTLSNPDAANLGDASALLVPGICNELYFPVTFGLKYNF